MKPEGAFLHSQDRANCSYPMPDQSSPCPPLPSHFMKIHFCIYPPVYS